MSPQTMVEIIEETLIPQLTRRKAKRIIKAHNSRAAGVAGVRAIDASSTASEALSAYGTAIRLKKVATRYTRKWDRSTAHEIHHICFLVGLGVSTYQSVGERNYGIDDYLSLVEPFMSEFSDILLLLEVYLTD